MRVLMMIGMMACLVSVSYAATGTATFYTPPYVRKSLQTIFCTRFCKFEGVIFSF